MIKTRKLNDQDMSKLIALCEKENIPRAESGEGKGYEPNRYIWIQNTLNLYGQMRNGDETYLALGSFDEDENMVAFLTAATFHNWYNGDLVADMKDVCTDLTHDEYHIAFEQIFGEFIRYYKERNVDKWRADTIRNEEDSAKFAAYIAKVFGDENHIVKQTSIRGIVK